MSSLPKKILKCAAAVIALGAVGIGGTLFYFTRPSVQRNLALKTLEEQGIPAEINEVYAGLGGTITLDGLVLKLPAGLIKCDSGKIEYSLFSLLKKRVEINSISVTGLSVDLSQKTPATKKTEPATKTETPSDAPAEPLDIVLAIKDANIAGTVKLEGGQEFSYNFKGVKIDSTSGGEIFLNAKEEKTAAPRTLNVNAQLAFAKKLEAIPTGIKAIFDAKPNLVLTGKLTDTAGEGLVLTANSSGSDTAQTWTAQLAPVKGRPVFETTGNISAAGVVDATLKVALDNDALPLVADLIKLPHLKITGDAIIKGGDKTPYAGEFSFAGNVDNFARFDSALAGVPALKFGLTGSGNAAPTTAALEKFEFTLGPATGENFAAVRLAKIISANKTGDAWALANTAGDLVNFSINKFPVTLANAFIPEAAKNFKIESGAIDAEFAIAAESADAVRLRTSKPLTLSNLAVSDAGKTYIEKISAIVPIAFALEKGNWKLDTNGIAFKSGAHALLDAGVTAGSIAGGPIDFSVNAVAHSDALAAQPAWKDILSAVAGQDWRIKLSATGSAKDGAVIKNAEVSAAKGEGRSLLTAKTLLPVDTANLAGIEGKPALRVDAESIPLALATPFLGGATLDGTALGAFVIVKNPANISIETPADSPISLRGVSYTGADKKALLKDFHLEGRAAIKVATDDSKTWSINFNDAKMDAGDGKALSGALALDWGATGLKTASANLAGDPARLLRQPLLGGFEKLESAHLSLKGGYTGAGDCDINLLVENIKTSGETAPAAKKLSASLKGNIGAKGGKIDLPLTLENEKLSDIFVGATIAEDGKITVNLKSDTVNVPDFQKLAGAFSKPETTDNNSAATPEAAPDTTPDKTPFWGSLNVDATAGIRQILIPNFSVTDFATHATVDPSAVVLDKLSANAADGTAGGQIRLDFKTSVPANPYDLTGAINLKNIDFARLLEAFSPKSAKVITGRFDTTVKLAAIAPNSGMLAKNLDASLDLESKNGRVAIFQMDNSLVKTVGELSGLAGGVAEIVSGLAGSSKAGKITQPLQSFSDIQKYLADFPYDQATIQVKRPSNGDINIAQLLLKNDQLIMNGNGLVSLSSGKDFSDAPLQLNASLAARDTLASGLSNLKMLKGEKRADGYTPGPDFALTGSINSIQNNLFSTLFDAAKGTSASVTNKAEETKATTEEQTDEKKTKADQAIQKGLNVLKGLGL